MTERTKFLRQETVSARNKCKRAPLPKDWTVADEPYSLPERRALSLKKILDNMPLFIGEKELIVGTRTLFSPQQGNENGDSVFAYSLNAGVPYVSEADIDLFGVDESFMNKTHYTPDMSILLEKGVGGILASVEKRLDDNSISDIQVDFLKSVHIAYKGLENLFLRYSSYAEELAATEQDATQKNEYLMIAANCKKMSWAPPSSFYEAVQLLWLGHLVTNIESFQFINYGRLDVILDKYLTKETDNEARQLLECLLLKMYDQVDIAVSALGKYSGQLVITLGGIFSDGENAVSRTSMLFLDAIDSVRLPEPEFNLRIHSKNPPEFLEKAAELTITGCNFVSYYNDDLFVENMIKAGVKPEYAKDYGFDLCQDINIPGRGDYFTSGQITMTEILMEQLYNKDDYTTFDKLYSDYKVLLAGKIKNILEEFNSQLSMVLEYRDGGREKFFAKRAGEKLSVNCRRRSIMSPLPYLSALFHGCIETAFDVTLEGHPDKNKGAFLGTSTECVNSLAAIKKIVFDQKLYTLKQVVDACRNNYQGEGEEVIRNFLWSAPKWGNDNDYVDKIAKDILEYGLNEILKYKTPSGGRHLSGIHQPHPVTAGERIGATPEGRYAKTPIAVTLTPESGSMKNGPTAALKSAAKLDTDLIQWNYCVMINYFASAFQGNGGKEIFIKLLKGYFADGGMQHQPNVMDVAQLKQAQQNPEKYKDLIVRLWGVSAHFVDLPLKFQNELIARFS